ncbi:hypothetical protein BFJ69_g12398 [Fusarium oxysporum]|uniref:Uncharacterized protein n=1 Tax=Fusarium oxysporum TaxID=5507 RepID=A0A420MP42_FUSOX|nr:hypothetical protein BFJ69_g12398 [Fusarium oxysporum]
MNINTPFTESVIVETDMESAAWHIGFLLSAPGFPLQQAFDAFQLGLSLNAASYPCEESSKIWHVQDKYCPSQSLSSLDDGVLTPQSMDDAQQDVAILPRDCEILLPEHHSPLNSESEQAETLAAQTLDKPQAAVEYTAESIEIEPCWGTDDSSDASGLISPGLRITHRQTPSPGSPASTVEESPASSPERSSTPPSSPSMLSNSPTQVTTTDASDAPANEEGGNGLVMDRQTKSPGSPGSSATQVAVPSEPASPQAPIYIDLTGEDEPSDGGIPASKPKSEGRRKRKYGHENVHSEQLSLSQARKRPRTERNLEEDELRLRAKGIAWERGQERRHQTAYLDGHKWSSKEFMQDPECIIGMEVIVNNGNHQTLWLFKTGQTDGQDIVWEGDDAFGTYKVSFASKDIESMIGKDYRTVIKKYKYIEIDI